MSELKKRLLNAEKDLNIHPGDIYEDCFYHPVFCVGVDYKEDEIWGISLIDGSQPRSCSILHCGVRKLSADEAWKVKQSGPSDAGVREQIENKWWTARD